MGTLGLFIFSADGGELSGTVADGGGQRRVSGYLVPWAPLGVRTEMWEFLFDIRNQDFLQGMYLDLENLNLSPTPSFRSRLMNLYRIELGSRSVKGHVCTEEI